MLLTKFETFGTYYDQIKDKHDADEFIFNGDIFFKK